MPWFKPNDPNSSVRIDLPGGCVVATARLVTAFQVAEHSERDEFAVCGCWEDPVCPRRLHVATIDQYGDYSIGRWIWVLDKIEKLDPPIAVKGHQGLWNWDPHPEVF